MVENVSLCLLSDYIVPRSAVSNMLTDVRSDHRLNVLRKSSSKENKTSKEDNNRVWWKLGLIWNHHSSLKMYRSSEIFVLFVFCDAQHILAVVIVITFIKTF